MRLWNLLDQIRGARPVEFPEVGRVYITDTDEHRAGLLGGNPKCRLGVALSGVAGSPPLLVIAEMQPE